MTYSEISKECFKRYHNLSEIIIFNSVTKIIFLFTFNSE